MSSGGTDLDTVVERLSKGVNRIRSTAPSKAKCARPMAEARARRLFALGLLIVASLSLVVAACLYTSVFRIEGVCALSGDRLCAAASHRMWTAAATAGVASLIGLVAAVDFVRGAKGGLGPGPRWPGPGSAA